MSAKKAWILYTLLRLVFFVVPFAVIMLLLPTELRFSLNWGVVFALVCATLISLALSVLLLGPLRHRAAHALTEWRKNAHEEAAAAEDHLLDANPAAANQQELRHTDAGHSNAEPTAQASKEASSR